MASSKRDNVNYSGINQKGLSCRLSVFKRNLLVLEMNGSNEAEGEFY